MENKKLSSGRKIVILITLIIFIVGLFLLISGIKMNVPKMGESGWMEQRSNKSARIGFGSFLTMAGFVMTVMLNTIPRLSSISKNFINNSMDTLEDINDRMVEMKKKHQNVNHTSCSYCGTTFNISKEKCPNCGAPNKK